MPTCVALCVVTRLLLWPPLSVFWRICPLQLIFFEGGYFLLQINALILWSETVSAFDSSFLLRRISANDLGAAALVAHSAQSDLVVLRFKTLFLSADPCRQK